MRLLGIFRKFDRYLSNDNTGSEIPEELHHILTVATILPKAPWEEGICKVCGIDRDDHNVLLCDKCDLEYHTYCLNTPLARIPKGDRFCTSCMSKPKKWQLHQGAEYFTRERKGGDSHAFHDKPSCMSGQKKSQLDQGVQDLKRQRKGAFCGINTKLVVAMEQKEYMELSSQAVCVFSSMFQADISIV